MDTATYASIPVIPWHVAESSLRPVMPETELRPLDLSYIRWQPKGVGKPSIGRKNALESKVAE